MIVISMMGLLGVYCPLLAKLMAALCLSKDADDGLALAILSHDGIRGQKTLRTGRIFVF